MRIPVCVQIEDEDSGETVLFDIEAEVDASLEWYQGEPRADISSVYLHGVELLRSRNTFFQQLGLIIADKAEDDDNVLSRLLEAEGVHFAGHPNDPASGWRVTP